MSTQKMKDQAKQQLKKKLKNGSLGEVDLSLISFGFIFETNVLGRQIHFPMTMRYQTFKESKEFGEIISPNSDIPEGDKNKRYQELMEKLLIKPSNEKFSIMFDQLHEQEIEEFLIQFAEAKEESRKK